MLRELGRHHDVFDLATLTLALTCACWRNGRRLAAVSEKLERGQSMDSVDEPFVGVEKPFLGVEHPFRGVDKPWASLRMPPQPEKHAS